MQCICQYVGKLAMCHESCLLYVMSHVSYVSCICQYVGKLAINLLNMHQKHPTHHQFFERAQPILSRAQKK